MYIFDDQKIDEKLRSTNYGDFVPYGFRNKTKYIEFLSPFFHATFPKPTPRKSELDNLRALLKTLDTIVQEKRKYYHEGWKEAWKPVIAFQRQLYVKKMNQIGYQCRLDSDGDVRISDTEFVDFSWIRPERSHVKLQMIRIRLRYSIPKSELLLKNITSNRCELTDSYHDWVDSENVQTFTRDIQRKLQSLMNEQEAVEAFRTLFRSQQEKHQEASRVYTQLFQTLQEIEDETATYAKSLGLVWGQFEVKDLEDID